MALRHEIHCLQVAEGGRTDLAAIGFVRPVADQIDAKFALGAFGRHVHFACGHVKAFSVELEVVDQRFHRLLHLGALGRRDLAIIRADRAGRHLRQALLDDLRAFVDFLHAHDEAVVTVRIGADGNVEFHAFIHIVGLRFAQVPRDARSADHRPGKPPSDRIVLADHGDVDIALLEDAVVEHEAHRVAKQFLQPAIDPIADIDQQLLGHVLVDPPGAEPGAVHPCTRCPFEEIHAVFAKFEHPQVRRHRTDVHDVGTDIEHVVADPRQLREQHAQILRPLGHFDVEQLFDREDVAVFLRQRRTVVEPVEIRQRLQIGLVLDQLFGAAVEQSDMRIDAFDDLAVELHHHPQHAVRRRVLRPEVDRVIGDHFVAGRRRLFQMHGVAHEQIQLPL